jgi:hypothetical protein
VAALSQAHDAWRKSESISEKAIGDIAKLGRAMSSAMAALGVAWSANVRDADRGGWSPS